MADQTEKCLRYLTEVAIAPHYDYREYVRSRGQPLPLSGMDEMLTAANRLPDRTWLTEASDPTARLAITTDSAMLFWLLQTSLCQLGNAVRQLVDHADTLEDPNAWLRQQLYTLLEAYTCHTGTPGVKHVLHGLFGGKTPQEFAIDLVNRLRRWNWELPNHQTVPQISPQLSQLPAAVALLVEPRTAVLFDMLGLGATMLAYLVFMSLAPDQLQSDHERLARQATEAQGNFPAEDLDAAKTRRRTLQEKWRELQQAQPDDDTLCSFNLWRLRARLGLLNITVRALLRCVVNTFADALGEEAAGMLTYDHTAANFAQVHQFLRDRTDKWSVTLDGKTLAKLAALNSNNTTPKPQLLPAKQGHDHIAKNVRDIRSAYGIPKLDADQLTWESWFNKLRETRTMFDMTDLQIVHAATDHLNREHLLLAGWPEHRETCQARGRTATLEEFIDNARLHLFAQKATRQSALQHLQTLFHDPCAKAEDCQDLSLLLNRLFIKVFPPSSDEILAVSIWNIVSLLHKVLLDLHRRPPAQYRKHTLVLEWTDYQWDYTKAHSDFLTPDKHRTTVESDGAGRQYMATVCDSLIQAHRLYGQLARAIGPLGMLQSPHESGHNSAMIANHGLPPRKSALKGSTGHDTVNGRKPDARVRFDLTDHSGVPRDPNPMRRNRTRAQRDKSPGPFPVTRGQRTHAPPPASDRGRSPGPSSGRQNTGPLSTPRSGNRMSTAPISGASSDASMASQPPLSLPCPEVNHFTATPTLPGQQKSSATGLPAGVFAAPPNIPSVSPSQPSTAPVSGKRKHTGVDYWFIEANSPAPYRLDALHYAVYNDEASCHMHTLLQDMQENRCPLCKDKAHPHGPDTCHAVRTARGPALDRILTERMQWRSDCLAHGVEAAARSRIGLNEGGNPPTRFFQDERLRVPSIPAQVQAAYNIRARDRSSRRAAKRA